MGEFDDIEKQLRAVNFFRFSKKKDLLLKTPAEYRKRKQQAEVQSILNEYDDARLSDDDLDYVTAAGQLLSPPDEYKKI